MESRKVLGRWRSSRFPVIGRQRIVRDFAQRHSVAAPAALECAGIHVIDEDALVDDLALGDIDLMGSLVQIKTRHSAVKRIGLLVVVLQGRSPLSRLGRRSAMSKLPK